MPKFPFLAAALAAAAVIISPDLLFAQDVEPAGAPDSAELLEGLAAQLLRLLIVAIFIEIALSMIFDTRAWQIYAEARTGAKTAVTLGVSLAVVWSFAFNIFGDVMKAVNPGAEDNSWQGPVSYAVTALLVAGGNSTVYKLYRALNIRRPALGGAAAVALSGKGTLAITTTRSTITAETPVAIHLDRVYLGPLESDGTFKRENVPAGSYALTFKYMNSAAEIETKERLVTIDPDKPTNLMIAI